MPKNLAPTGRERPFSVEEMLFSRTDKRGVIEFGNGIFVKISGYEESEMLGKPHNLIRHPDMPKAVFKIFWDMVQAGEPIVAYVKNMAKSGDHYWVIAAAFPIEGGFISIRLKPTSELFSKVQQIYQEVLAVEKKSGMEASGTELLRLLAENGFANYREFMIHALFVELRARDRSLERVETARNAIERVAMSASQTFRDVFDTTDGFGASQQVFRDKIDALTEEFVDLELVSLNLRVLSVNVGEGGVAMGKIAEQFQRVASDIKSHLGAFSKIITSANADLKGCLLNIAFMKTQTDMVDFFVREIASAGRDGENSHNAKASLDANSETFSALCRESHKAALKALFSLEHILAEIGEASKEVKKYINGLDVIEKMGTIEASRTEEMRSAVADHLETLGRFNQNLRVAVREVGEVENDMRKATCRIMAQLDEVAGSLDQIFALARSESESGAERSAPSLEARFEVRTA